MDNYCSNTDKFGITTEVYKFDNYTKTYIRSDKNKTNYLTIIKEYNIINSNNKSMLEIGIVYNTYYKFDEQGEIIYERRYNKKLKVSNITEKVISNDYGEILINIYKNQKSIKFKFKKNGWKSK